MTSFTNLARAAAAATAALFVAVAMVTAAAGPALTQVAALSA